MPAEFGSDTTWIKAKHAGSDKYEYFNLYQLTAIQKIDTDRYIIQIGPVGYILTDVVQVDDLSEIEPPEG